jgi:hypothetical protein
VFYIAYVSAAVRRFSKSELVELLEQSRQKNTRLGLTGMLLYKDGDFMQVLEGDEPVVREAMATIERDPRHTHFMPLIHGNIEERQFSEWSMGFRDLNSPEVRSASGYSAFLNTPLTDAEFVADPGKAHRLLLSFKSTM